MVRELTQQVVTASNINKWHIERVIPAGCGHPWPDRAIPFGMQIGTMLFDMACDARIGTKDSTLNLAGRAQLRQTALGKKYRSLFIKQHRIGINRAVERALEQVFDHMRWKEELASGAGIFEPICARPNQVAVGNLVEI